MRLAAVALRAKLASNDIAPIVAAISARRENKAHPAIKNPVLGEGTGQPTNPPKTSNKNNRLQGAKIGSSRFANAPLNILGGGSWRWPDTPHIDHITWGKVVRAEVGDAS